MKMQGLCLSCVNKTSCIYTKNGQVLFCEEFSDYAPVSVVIPAKSLKINQACSCAAQEE